MPETIDTAAEIQFLKNWAADNKVIFEDDGEVGFGRTCVGITDGNAYVDLGPLKTEDFGGGQAFTFPQPIPESEEPEGVEHSYHKHPCLAVLGSGPSAIHELFLWVTALKERNVVVVKGERPVGNIYEALLNGTTASWLEVKDDDATRLLAEEHEGLAILPTSTLASVTSA